jgi:hypothetical protein
VADLNLRSVIDQIALEVAEAGLEPSGLEKAVSERASAYIKSEIEAGNIKTDEEIDRVLAAIIRGVLERLLQIAESGGQIGRA